LKAEGKDDERPRTVTTRLNVRLGANISEFLAMCWIGNIDRDQARPIVCNESIVA